MQDFLDQHFGAILENRANKDWKPSPHALAEVAKAYPKIIGLGVQTDPYCDAKTIELRAETGKLMASYGGVRL